MKLDCARKWQRRLGHLNQTDGVRTAPKKVGELEDISNVGALAKITKTPVQSSRVPSRREAGEGGVYRRDETFPSRVTLRIPVLHYVCKKAHKICVWRLALGEEWSPVHSEKFVIGVGTHRMPRHDNAKQFLTEQLKMYGIQKEKTVPQTTKQNELVEKYNMKLLEIARYLLRD